MVMNTPTHHNPNAHTSLVGTRADSPLKLGSQDTKMAPALLLGDGRQGL